VKIHFFILANVNTALDLEDKFKGNKPSKYRDEAEYIMIMQLEEDDEENEERKFVAINLTKTTYEIITPY
jgi:hypothetical protein